MPEIKKGFILYKDLKYTLDKIPNEQAGLLFKHILNYVNGLDPKTEDLIVEISFEPIKQQLKRDLNIWEDKVEARSLSGKEGNLKRWSKDLYLKFKKGEITLEQAVDTAKSRKQSQPDNLQSQPFANIAHKDTVTVKGKDIVKDTVIEINKKFVFRKKMIELGFQENLVTDWVKVRKTKKLSQTETALRAFLKQVKNTDADKNEVLKLCVEKSWGGFKSDWYFKEKNSGQKENSKGVYTDVGNELAQAMQDLENE